MESISSRIASVSPSLTLAVTQQAKNMQAEGKLVYGLAGGEPDLPTPEVVTAAAIKALQEGKTKYAPSSGIPELREAIATKLTKENGITCEASQVVVSAGAKFACYEAIAAVIEEGDEVIIPAPYWVSYPEMVRLAGGVPVIVETTAESGWKMTAEQFDAHMSGLTKMVIINSPGNPTGAVYTEEELKALGEVALSEDIMILSDEIYEKMIYGEAKHVSIASLSEELAALTITVNGFSKAYSMTGWRLGYTVSSPAVSKAIATMQSHLTSNATTFAQYGAVEAMVNPEVDQFVEDMRAEYDVRRKFVLSRLQAIPNITVVEPEGAFYFFVALDQLGMSSINICDKLISRYKLVAVPGAAFGYDTGIRLSYCVGLDVLNEGLNAFAEFCQDH